MKISKTIKNLFSEEYALYLIVYKNSKKKLREHVICHPLNMTQSFHGGTFGFKTYSFGRGIRFFVSDRVVSKTRIYHLPDLAPMIAESTQDDK